MGEGRLHGGGLPNSRHCVLARVAAQTRLHAFLLKISKKNNIFQINKNRKLFCEILWLQMRKNGRIFERNIMLMLFWL